ncbi:MAG: hypothetical protein Q8L85_04800 [Alphaproteobacteria bacterium]|nr:hypothetical protein [Alphaproteobacteria bacterium]
MLRKIKVLLMSFMFMFLFFGKAFADKWPIWNGHEAIDDIIAPGMTKYGNYRYDLVQKSLKKEDRQKIKNIKKKKASFHVSLAPQHKGRKYNKEERHYKLIFTFNEYKPLEIIVKVKREPVSAEEMEISYNKHDAKKSNKHKEKSILDKISDIEIQIEIFAENFIHNILDRFKPKKHVNDPTPVAIQEEAQKDMKLLDNSSSNSQFLSEEIEEYKNDIVLVPLNLVLMDDSHDEIFFTAPPALISIIDQDPIVQLIQDETDRQLKEMINNYQQQLQSIEQGFQSKLDELKEKINNK